MGFMCVSSVGCWRLTSFCRKKTFSNAENCGTIEIKVDILIAEVFVRESE